MDKNLRSNSNKRDNTTPLKNDAKNMCLSFSPSRLESMFKKIDKQFELLIAQVKESEERILLKLNEQIINIENKLLNELEKHISDTVSQINNIKERVSYVESQCTEIVLLKGEIKSLKAQINRQENLSVSCDLRISGIPFVKNEKLDEIFVRVCTALNISTPAYKSIFRLQNRNIKLVKSPDAVILVKLCSAYDKNFILKSLALFKKSNRSQFCLQHIGFTSHNNSIVYLNENLTSNSYKILNAAISLRKKNRLTSAFTLRGLVYIKVNPGDKPMCFEDLNELLKFFPESSENTLADFST